MKSLDICITPGSPLPSAHGSPVPVMKWTNGLVTSGSITLESGRPQLTVMPSRTSAAARLRVSGVMWLTAPSSSSPPHRPQLLHDSK